MEIETLLNDLTTTGVAPGWRLQLEEAINRMILQDFNGLVQLLYRVDVDEQKLKKILHGAMDVDAARLIADELILRQQQKLLARQNTERPSIPPEDAW
jgi:hypothetical protein